MRESGVIIVPRRMRCVTIAAAASETQASTPHTGSHTKNPSQPASSAAWANSAAVRASHLERQNRISSEPPACNNKSHSVYLRNPFPSRKRVSATSTIEQNHLQDSFQILKNFPILEPHHS